MTAGQRQNSKSNTNRTVQNSTVVLLKGLKRCTVYDRLSLFEQKTLVVINTKVNGPSISQPEWVTVHSIYIIPTPIRTQCSKTTKTFSSHTICLITHEILHNKCSPSTRKRSILKALLQLLFTEFQITGYQLTYHS